jgi:hypothetical protein
LGTIRTGIGKTPSIPRDGGGDVRRDKEEIDFSAQFRLIDHCKTFQ